jgi:hypothetical protein
MKAIGLIFLLAPLSAFALGNSVRELVHNETRSNAVAVRSEKMVSIQNFEIPMRILTPDLSDRLPPEVKSSLIFTKNGEEYVRWVINPEDTKWRLRLEKFMRDRGVWPVLHQHFKGYQTASRSYIVEDPNSHAQFSLKVSTNNTGGEWKDKKQTAADAGDVRRSTDYVMEEGKRQPYQNFIVMDEPAAFQIKEIDQGMLVRILADLPREEFHYLPGFSAVHAEVGRAIANLNGSLDPAVFWNTHYNKPLARSLAELAGRTGVTFDSPHSQNFLIELDKNYKPTGRMVLRDLGDVFIVPEIVSANGYKDLAAKWPAENTLSYQLRASAGLLHGNQYPDWLDSEKYTKWGEDFFVEFNQQLSKTTGIPLESLPNKPWWSGRYVMQDYATNLPVWMDYKRRLRQAHAGRTAPAISAHASCGDNFGQLAK